MEPVVKVDNITKVFGKGNNTFTAINPIEFSIQEGEFVGIMGPSGAGKSTLLNMLATIDTPTSGSISINGKAIEQLSEHQLADFRRDHLGFIFQDYNLLDSLTVKENIVLPLAIAKKSKETIEKEVQRITRLFGIEKLLNKYPYQISGGQKQRTAASRALITNPALLLADEPTGALDSKSATDLLEKLSSLNEHNQSTIMMVTHDAFAASFCGRILFIQDGKLSHELYRKNNSREEFFQIILATLAKMGGATDDAI